jgi:hypothetical protein
MSRLLLVVSGSFIVVLIVGCGGGFTTVPPPRATIRTQSSSPDGSTDASPPVRYAEALRESCTLGTVTVSVERVVLDHLTTRGGFRRDTVLRSDEPQLQLTIRVVQSDPTKKEIYIHWNDSPGRADLRDEYGNLYGGRPFALSRPDLHVAAQDFTSEKPIRDLLAFDPPLRTATELKLELVGHVVGVKNGSFRFRIPKSAWAPPR